MSTAHCTIIEPGQSNPRWVLSDLVSTLVTAGQSGGAYSVIETVVPPQGGPPPHLHQREDELFYILEGTFSMILGSEAFTASAGEALFLPRGIIHTFRNVGALPGRILTVAMPGGFDAFMAELGEPCADPLVVPAVTEQTLRRLESACARHGLDLYPKWQATRTTAPRPRPRPRELWVLGLHIRLLARGDETRGALSVAEINVFPGNFVPPHRHRREDEFFYVINGTVEFELEGRLHDAMPGTFIHVPRGVLHGFRNTSSAPAQLADFHTPGGFDRFFEESGVECTEVRQGPPQVLPDMEQFFAVCRRHGMEVALPVTA